MPVVNAQEHLRALPSVEKLIVAVGENPAIPRLLSTRFIRDTVARLRETVVQNEEAPPPFADIVSETRQALEALARSRIQPVINGTGVMIHTNLGRSPLAPTVADRLREIACQYNNLELDLETGERGHRGRFLEYSLATLTGAPAATVTNNCAAALVLMLRHFVALGKHEIIIARSQLVEIGGGFRVPEIMETSGAILREVGATNKVGIADYQRAFTVDTGAILRVHRSNFYMDGFIGEPETGELVALGNEHDVPVIEDLGSGAIVATETLAPIDHEPTPQEILAHGVALVCFSGDKLFAGPQAGIICGHGALIASIKKDPMFRALRCDRIILTALQETVLAYLTASSNGTHGIPLLEMLALEHESLRQRAEAIIGALAGCPVDATIGTGTSRCGGGTMPRSSQPTVTVDLKPGAMSLASLAAALRRHTPPIVGYTADGQFKLDLRTIFSHQDATVVTAIRLLLPPQS